MKSTDSLLPDKKGWLPLILGFFSLSFQVFLLREFAAHFSGNEAVFGLTLASWLLWSGLGSLSASLFPFHAKNLDILFYILIMMVAIGFTGLRLSRFLFGTLPGEILGLFPILLSSLAVSMLVGFPIGLLFVVNVFYCDQNLTKVYMLESLGAAAGGIFVYFFFIPVFSSWKAAAIIGGLGMIIIFFSTGKKRFQLLHVPVILSLLFLWFCDLPTQKLYWNPFHLAQSTDSPFGKLQMIKEAEQISLFSNGSLVFSYPNPAVSEEAVHFALLQRPEARRVLMIGGGIGGGLKEALKYPQTKITYVETDPEIIRISLQYLPVEEKSLINNTRVHLIFRDGRAFLHDQKEKYHAILLNLPDPATAQINRFYTYEFFRLAASHLDEEGVFSFRVSSAENYISRELQNFLSSLYFSLKKSFAYVEVVPGTNNVFLASKSTLSIRLEDMEEQLRILDLNTTFVSPNLLFDRLNPFRISSLKKKILTGDSTMNLDMAPISYFYSSVLWSTQFQGLEKRLFLYLAKIPSFWLLDLPLILFLGILTFFSLRQNKSPFYLFPLAVMGMTTIIVELIVILSFQSRFGYVYKSVSLLLALFMTGLFCGALWGNRQKKSGYGFILLIQSGFVLLLILLQWSLGKPFPKFSGYVFLLIFGFLGGFLFVHANRLYLQIKKNYGLGYGLDLMGSFFGAMAASGILFPLFGLPLLTKYLLLVNSFCLIFLLLGSKKHFFFKSS
ncbi:MAG: hypothetical protein JXB26_03270 [Candidatus Aminicenantes bacterium]|nr:hypothetical protein [Candidatus Aminicenantes bacterium]